LLLERERPALYLRDLTSDGACRAPAALAPGAARSLSASTGSRALSTGGTLEMIPVDVAMDGAA